MRICTIPYAAVFIWTCRITCGMHRASFSEILEFQNPGDSFQYSTHDEFFHDEMQLMDYHLIRLR